MKSMWSEAPASPGPTSGPPPIHVQLIVDEVLRLLARFDFQIELLREADCSLEEAEAGRRLARCTRRSAGGGRGCVGGGDGGGGAVNDQADKAASPDAGVENGELGHETYAMCVGNPAQNVAETCSGPKPDLKLRFHRACTRGSSPQLASEGTIGEAGPPCDTSENTLDPVPLHGPFEGLNVVCKSGLEELLKL